MQRPTVLRGSSARRYQPRDCEARLRPLTRENGDTGRGAREGSARRRPAPGPTGSSCRDGRRSCPVSLAIMSGRPGSIKSSRGRVEMPLLRSIYSEVAPKRSSMRSRMRSTRRWSPCSTFRNATGFRSSPNVPRDLRFDPNYLDIDRDQGFLLIRITLALGRTTDAKRAFYRRVAGLLVSAPESGPRTSRWPWSRTNARTGPSATARQATSSFPVAPGDDVARPASAARAGRLVANGVERETSEATIAFVAVRSSGCRTTARAHRRPYGGAVVKG